MRRCNIYDILIKIIRFSPPLPIQTQKLTPMSMKTTKSEKHRCTSFRAGDWIVYRCTECDYELRENWRTKEVQIRNEKRDVKHYGGFFPEEYREAFENLN